MSTEKWQAWEVIGGTIFVWLSLGLLFYAKAVKPMLNTFKRFDTVADQVMGDEKNGTPSLREFIKREVKQGLGEHVEDWHNPSKASNGPRPIVKRR